MRLIDADKLKYDIDYRLVIEAHAGDYESIKDLVDDQPTVGTDKVERKNGWHKIIIATGDGFSFEFVKCDFCKFCIPTLYLDVTRYNFCPNCGAKMVEEEK